VPVIEQHLYQPGHAHSFQAAHRGIVAAQLSDRTPQRCEHCVTPAEDYSQVRSNTGTQGFRRTVLDPWYLGAAMPE